MKYSTRFGLVASVALIFAGGAVAQQQPAAPPQLPQAPNMTFFVTGNGPGKGADLGGIEGADRYCQTLAQRHGAGGKTWHAYLSTQAADGKPAINARDGRTSKARWSRPASTICTATATSSASTIR
jgi:hypothetical protein